MQIDFDEIRQKVAIRHNVLLGADDPILVTVTLNELVLERYLEMANEKFSAANRELTITMQQQVEQSKATAGRVITDAADYVAKEVRQAVASATADAAGQLRQQIADAQALSRDALNSSRDAQTAKNGTMIAAVLAGVAALVSVAAVVVVLLK